ncbi:MAG: Panacea domain-containing protein [Pseudonocardiaceae bacterium]
MAQVADVAAYILEKCGLMTAMKLQKLTYYSQAWHLVWTETPLFDDRIEAWASGPVVHELYNLHRGRFSLSGSAEIPGGDSSRVTDQERATIDVVLGAYGDKSAHWLSELTHNEDPWRNARERADLGDRDRGNTVISLDSMLEYYDGLTSADAEAL